MATKVKTGVIDSGAITSALITDASITADDLHTTLDLTGKTVTVSTASAGDNDTSVASTAYVDVAIANLTDSAPSTLDTLNELAAALGDDANFSTTVTNSIATKLPLAGGTMTGNIAHASDLTLDVAGDIYLDAGGDDIYLSQGGTHFGQFKRNSSNYEIHSLLSDGDIVFKGNDGGSTVTALTLDMSEAGDAYFNNRVSVGGVVTNTSANADDIVIGSYNDATERGITFASTTGGGIRWNDAADAGVIQYSHSSNEMYYSSTSHHRFVATTSDTAGLVRINTADAGSGVLHIKAGDQAEDGIGALDLRSPNSAMRIGGTAGRSWIQSHDSQPLYINKLGNNVIFHADGSGGVGIGTESVNGKLHVSAGSSASTVVQFGGAYDTSVKIGPVTNTASGMLQFLNSSGTSKWSLGYRDSNASGTDGIFRIRRGATLDTAGPYFQLGTDGQAYLETTTESESIYQLRIGTSVNANPSRANLGFTSGLGLLAKIEAEQRAGGSQPYGHLAFWTSDNGSMQQRMTLNYDGRLGIGLNHVNPACLVHIYETNAQNDALGLLQVQQANTTSGGSQTNASITIKNYHGTSQFMQWEENGLRIGSRILTNSGVGDLHFTTGNDSVKLTIPDSGSAVFAASTVNINNSGTYPIRAATSGGALRGAAVHHLITHDHRTPKQNSMTHGHMGFGFTSYALNNTSPWADIIYLNSYTDASGGSPNAILINKYSSNAKIVRYPWSNTSTTDISGGVTYTFDVTSGSDERLKENVQNITNGLDIIKALRPVTFNWNDTYIQSGSSRNIEEQELTGEEELNIAIPETKVENVGLIAQEVEAVVPTVVHEGQISIGGVDYKNVDYKKLVPHLIAALQEADAKIEALTTRIETLEG